MYLDELCEVTRPFDKHTHTYSHTHTHAHSPYMFFLLATPDSPFCGHYVNLYASYAHICLLTSAIKYLVDLCYICGEMGAEHSCGVYMTRGIGPPNVLTRIHAAIANLASSDVIAQSRDLMWSVAVNLSGETLPYSFVRYA